MKPVLSGTLTNLNTSHSNEVKLIVQAEWLHNKFYRTVVDNTPTEDTDGYDIEMFPIESITKANRPTAGINKAVVGQAKAEPSYHDVVPSARYYTASVDDVYKYWQSPYSAGASPNFTMASCAPQVLYVEDNDVSGSPVPRTVVANKIHYTVESTWAKPVTYNVQIKTTTGGAWATIASDIAIPSNGKIELWYNGTSWTTTKVLTSTTTVHAVRLVVTAMNKQAYFNLIELGAALELDLSADVVTQSDSFNMGEVDFITPLGKISSNTGSITLFNDTRKYSDDNASSILFGLLDKGVIVRCWYDYTTETFQEFKLFSDDWREEEDQVTVTLVDESKFFMDTKPPVVLYRGVPVQEAVWRICDIIGFNNYEVTTLDTSPHAIIDIFWTDGEKTAWEIFSDLARATQTAIYFDSYGVLQVKTRYAAWDDAQTEAYTFVRNSGTGGILANIAECTEDTQYEANKATINWKPTGFSERVDNIIPFEVVWEPDGDVVLRASELAKDITYNDTIITLQQRDAATWPWKGMCQIEGEWISYEGKRYVYYNASGVRSSAWVYDYEGQKRFDSMTPATKLHQNHYNGQLQVTERGLYNTDPQGHHIDLNGWTKTRQRDYGVSVSPCPGIKLNRKESTVTISTPKTMDMNDYTYLVRGNGVDTGYLYLGTRMRIDRTAHTDKVGGIFFNADGGVGTGYYLEVMATARMTSNMRNIRNEVILYSMKSDGTKKVVGGEEIVLKDKSKNHAQGATTRHDIGAEMAVPMGSFIDFDIIFTDLTNDKIQVWANGRFLFEATIPDGWQHSKISRFGLFARGHSSVSFDYVYAISNAGIIPPDGESYYDRIDGGYRGYQWQKDWTYETRTVRRRIKKKWTKMKNKYNQRFFDEFGPIVHEIRRFDVKFTNETPSLQAKLYYSNTSQIACTEFWSSPKEAHFILANITRQNAIVSGDDELTAQGNGTINHKLFVYGRPVIQKDAQQIVKTDDWAIRRRGVIDIEYESPWIQNEQEANRFASWLTTHWTRSDSVLTLEVFGNPLIELTDVVRVIYNDINAKYYVTAIQNEYNAGLTTTLTLRRVT